MKDKNKVLFEKEDIEFNLKEDIKDLSIEELNECEKLVQEIEEIIEKN